jgi:hypothetical protein
MQMKVVDEVAEARSFRMEVEGMAGSDSTLEVRRNDGAVRLRAEGGDLVGDQLRIHFPPGSGYVTQTVTVSW